MNTLPPGNVEESHQSCARKALQMGGKGHEKASEHLVEHEGEDLACLAFSEDHCRRSRDTNGFRCPNQEIEHRARMVGCGSTAQKLEAVLVER